MTVINASKINLFAVVYKGDLPLEQNKVASTSDANNFATHTFDLPSNGRYWVSMAIAQAPPVSGPVGTLVARTGGVQATETVIFSADLRLAIQS